MTGAAHVASAAPAEAAPALLRVQDVWFTYGPAAALDAVAKSVPGAEGARRGAAPPSQFLAAGERGPALQGVTLSVRLGERVAIVGRNGSGKTTLARLLNGLLRPQRGRVLVGGLDTAAHDPGRLAAVVGSVFQNPDHQLFSRTVREEVEFGPRTRGLPASEIERRATEALRSLGLEALESSPPATLGFAQRRLVAIASALAMGPAALVLDEPFAGLAWPNAVQIVALLRSLAERGAAVVVITHQMRAVAELASRCVVLDDGRVLADGPVETVLSDAPLLARAALVPPAVARLGDALRPHGFTGRAVRVDDFMDEFRRLRQPSASPDTVTPPQGRGAAGSEPQGDRA